MRKTTLHPLEKFVEKRSLICQKNFVLTFFLTIALGAMSIYQSTAQCTLACTDVNISVNMDCEAPVTVSMFADTSGCVGGNFIVNVYYDDELIPTSPLITSEYIDKTVVLEVVDLNSSNSCWSFGHVEEKFPPIIQCTDTTILSCGEVPNYPGPVAIDNCDDTVAAILIDEVFTLLNCDTTYISKLTRFYTAKDSKGNYSDTCTEVFLLERLDPSTVDFPDTLSVAKGTNLSCTGEWDLNNNGIPEPEEINSFPTVNGNTLYPYQLYCNTTVTYLDIPLPPVHCSQTIMRIWTVSEWWCNDQVKAIGTQLIEIADTTAPVITCPQDFTVSAGAHTCDATVFLPAAELSDNCSDIEDIRVDVKYPGGFLTDQNGGWIELPVGVHTIEYRAFDPCGNNMQNCFMEITVIDDNPPIAVCDQFTVVSLTFDGIGKIFASTFDDGSVDNCENVYFKVRRMDSNSCGGLNGDDDEITNGYQEYFDDFAKFCCEDIGAPVMVRFRVYDIDPGSGAVHPSRHDQGGDLFGRWNECMVEVEVQDKLPPQITCPPDITISCKYDFDPNDLEIFGTVALLESDRQDIIIDDPDYNNTPINWGKDGITNDNCIVDIDVIVTKKVNSCGVGDITRLFIAEDAGGRTATCLQRIDIIRVDEFEEIDITWPANYEAHDIGCGPNTLPPDSLPSGFDYPSYDDDECDQIFISYTDDVFTVNGLDGACFKILRTWKVIDWCGADENGNNFPIWDHIQVIKVFNTDGPEITSDCDSFSICTFDDQCESGQVQLSVKANDDCTPEEFLIYSYKIDLFTDDIYDIALNGNNASGEYPIGNHEILWTVEDQCGNKESCTQPFSVVNCKKPSPKCHSGIVTVVMEQGGTVDVWASEFDAGSSHICGYHVTASFSQDVFDIIATFDCDDLGVQDIEIWITDENGQQDFCMTTIEIQDDNNSNACDSNGLNNGDIQGLVATEENDQIEGVSINLIGSNLVEETKENGIYAFDDMPFGLSYVVSPFENDNPLNGVSTFDILLIQKHILGIAEFTSPYKLIAADVNNTESITALDMIELRRLLLGYNSEFLNNTSWRFIDSDFEFTDPTDPWEDNFPEEYLIDPFDSDMLINWTAVKIGDLNNSSEKSALIEEESEIRGLNEFVLEVNEQSWKAGESVSIEVTAADMANIVSYQYGWKFDPEVLEFDGFSSASLDIDESYFGTQFIEEGYLNTLWYHKEESLSANEVLYALNFNALRDGRLSNVLSISSDYLAAESYTAQAEKLDIVLEMRYDEAITDAMVLYQNNPNPFTEQTDISFLMSQNGEATISILDVTGKILWANTGYFDKGFNVVSVQAKSLSANGVLYYRLESGDFVETKKMIKLK